METLDAAQGRLRAVRRSAAARDSAVDVAWPSARDSAWDATKAALEPTKRALQDSAVLLFRRMVERGAEERVVCPTPWAY